MLRDRARTVVGGVSKHHGPPSAANHLALIRRFLIDSGMRDPAASGFAQKFFATHVGSLRSALMRAARRASMISRWCFGFAMRRDCYKKCLFHRCFCNIDKMRANYRECFARFAARPAPVSGLRVNGLRASDMYTLR